MHKECVIDGSGGGGEKKKEITPRARAYARIYVSIRVYYT